MSDDKITMAKKLVRKQLYAIINNIPKNEVIRQSDIVTKKIIENEKFQKAKVVSVYLSMKNEIQTENLLEHIFQQKKECFIPRFQPENSNMEMIRLTSMEQYHSLPKNKWDIKQPPDDEKIESIFDRGQLDIILAPGLGFTKEGLRIGRGKGYYDRFFAKCKRELTQFPFIIGLAFNEQILTDIPTDENDYHLDMIIHAE